MLQLQATSYIDAGAIKGMYWHCELKRHVQAQVLQHVYELAAQGYLHPPQPGAQLVNAGTLQVHHVHASPGCRAFLVGRVLLQGPDCEMSTVAQMLSGARRLIPGALLRRWGRRRGSSGGAGRGRPWAAGRRGGAAGGAARGAGRAAGGAAGAGGHRGGSGRPASAPGRLRRAGRRRWGLPCAPRRRHVSQHVSDVCWRFVHTTSIAICCSMVQMLHISRSPHDQHHPLLQHGLNT